MAKKAAPVEGEIVEQAPVAGDRQLEQTLSKIEGVFENKRLLATESYANQIFEVEKLVRFKGRLLVLVDAPFKHFETLTRSKFDDIAYPILGGLSRSKVSDIFAYCGSMAEDYTPYGHLMGFGQPLADMTVEADTDLALAVENPPTVWDMADTCLDTSYTIEHCVWRSPYSKIVPDKDEAGNHLPIPFIMQLAGGDKGVYDDIMQSIAAMVMDQKPDGVIWWVGNGANGKSTLMDALYRLFPGQLASINVKRLTDGRDTPSLNGKLANIVKESSEGRVDDTEIYKALGTHENFRVHKFHSQDDAEINGNIHSIFSANSIPTFNDKGYSARRRTFIIPFNQQFASDPDFERKTFTPKFFGLLAFEICKYAARLKRQGYKYKWSATTLNAKEDYDHEANNAEEYAAELIQQGVVAFSSYNPLRMDYENWCADNGYPPLGIGNLKKVFKSLGFARSSARADGSTEHLYKLPDMPATDLQSYGLGRLGLYTLPGFRETTEETKESTGQSSILDGKW